MYKVYVLFWHVWQQQDLQDVGKQIQDLYKEGYDAVGTGNNYPYVLASPMELENGEEILKAFEQSVSGDYDEKKSKITVRMEGK
jgi:raffinose/stachyose/melibiose transport system substrate-binding protein